MFPFLDLYLLQTLAYFTTKNLDIDQDELLQFIIFWMVNQPNTKTSSEASKQSIELINTGNTLKEIYKELTKEENSLLIPILQKTYLKLELNVLT